MAKGGDMKKKPRKPRNWGRVGGSHCRTSKCGKKVYVGIDVEGLDEIKKAREWLGKLVAHLGART